MSIPPLVCSTPPPPDQCEDDKDPEDFDLSYSLSQEDEDDDDNNVYNYGNLSAYNNFQSTPDNNIEIKGEEITKSLENEGSKEILSKHESDNESEHNNAIHSVLENNDINENKLKCEEDINIEDLNLKVDEEIESIVESNTEQIEINEHHNDRLKDFDIPCNSNNDSPTYDNTNVSPFDDNAIDSIDTIKELNSELFDEFQSVNVPSNITSIVENSENPWENSDSNESDFGNFTANFEDKKIDSNDLSPAETTTISNNLQQVECETKETDFNIEDDDFGDFNDFKSSAVQPEPNEFALEDQSAEPSQCHELPVLNLQSSENEHQIMESITKVLTSVFLEEISEPETDFEAKLESLLSETWGHLMETDERQPYIVNWNNSLGQKTLLKALCIDSRNILFGPKWSSNMPKYAANLSNAPLQPQKQVSIPSSVVTQNEISTEKSSSKPTTWTDPFTSDGQESCNTENENATITPGPTDLDVFESAISIKSDKIYSNTMDVQPLRQINLPDTHIFTPTDSEIPRSKTIHYDRGPTVLLPQPTMPDSKNPTDTVNIPSTHNVADNVPDDNEYWEFQNFKSTSDSCSLPASISNSQQQVTSQGNNFETATIVNALPKPNIAYQTELLQPIKVEPAMPTLNWPDPGEVKGVFDDFTDFVSIPSQPTQQRQDNIQPTEPHSVLTKPDNLSVFNEKTEAAAETTKHDDDDFEDDFDTFQSALPTKIVTDTLKSNYLGNPANQISNRIAEIDHGSPKLDSIKSDTISFPSISKPNEALTQNTGHISNTTELTNKSSPQSGKQMQTSLLQPTPVSFSTVNTQTQQKSGQILQPLSLESYSQINWPSPGIDLQDLSRFNPVETLHSLKSDLSVNSLTKVASPAHVVKNTMVNQIQDDDVWGEFVSSKPKQQQQSVPKKPSVLVDDDEWTDFISSPSVKPQNGLNTISLNVHTNSNMQKSVQSKFSKKTNQPPLDIPTLNYITPKSNPHKSYNDKHFQNL